MNIGIDITSLMYARGVSRYTANLTIALLEEKNTTLHLYASALRQRHVFEEFAQQLQKKHGSRVTTTFQNYPPTLMSFLWHTLKRGSIARKMPAIDIFHSWDWLQPPDTTIPIVSTIHDLAILKFPDQAHPKIVAQHQAAWEILKQRQAHLIAVSRATKQDIVSLLGYPAYLVHVVHEALPREVRAVSTSLTEERYEVLKHSLQLDKPYILFVGTREPRKNLHTLIEAWKPLAKEYDLIVAGEKGWDNSESTSLAGLRFLGKVSDAELTVLYSEAELFAYPSLYEGFGLPILEAFHHGTPVVTANNSGMTEVAGNAAEFVEPTDPESLRQGIERILHETQTEQQKRLQRMIIRLQMFSWERVAKETIAVYAQALRDFNE